jgi:long-subunit acyl-CoA synthetase (AMP-forming)
VCDRDTFGLPFTGGYINFRARPKHLTRMAEGEKIIPINIENEMRTADIE